MKRTVYHAHATRKDGEETIFDMRFDDREKAAVGLTDILYMELGDGKGDLRDDRSEIIDILYGGYRYSHADCEFWIDREEVGDGIGNCVWVLVARCADANAILLLDVFESKASLMNFMRKAVDGEKFDRTSQDLFRLNGNIQIGGIVYTFYSRKVKHEKLP